MNARATPDPAFWSDRIELAVLGCGTALPGPAISTHELLQRIDRQFGTRVQRRGAHLARRLGINSRHVSRALITRYEGTQPGDSNAELAARALESALARSAVPISDLVYVISHTATPSELVPPNVVQVARLLNYDGPVVEFRQACTGFANALVFAWAVLRGRSSGAVAIVGSETGSVYFDPLTAHANTGQLVNLVQMGDGAGAIVLGAGNGARAKLTQIFYGQGGGHPAAPGLRLNGGGSNNPAAGLPQFVHDPQLVRQQGPDLLRSALRAAATVGIEPRRVDYFLPHQANGRMGELLAQYLDLPAPRVFVNADRLGNTGSAAMWLAFSELRERLRAGETVLALGAEATGYMFGGFHYVHG